MTGLHYYNSRYYDDHIGQFISPDSIVPDPSNLFDYNRFMYVRGRVLNMNDPSGHAGGPGSLTGPMFDEFGGGGGGVAILAKTAIDLAVMTTIMAQTPIADKAPAVLDQAVQTMDSLIYMAKQGAHSGGSNNASQGGNTGTPDGWDPNKFQKVVDIAKQAQQRVGDTRGKISEYTGREYAEATLADGSIITHSGADSVTAPGGYTSGIRAANQLADKIGFKFPDYGFATHAEVKLAALAPNQPIGVSRPMCSVCQSFFQQLANYTGITQVVADPVKVHTFVPK